MAWRARVPRLRTLILGGGIALALGFACSRASMPDSESYAPPPPAEPASPVAAAPMADGRMREERALGAMGGKGGGGRGASATQKNAKAADPLAALDEPAPEDAPKQQRMVHYDGAIQLRVTDPRKTLDEAATMVTSMGGFVEQQNETMVMLRVPVEHIREAFTKLLGLGDVLSKSLSAADITDAFTATELRLKTMRVSRDRLIVLLASVKDEEERLEILGEIRRLTEEIDALDMRVKTLAKLAAFSRLTLQVQPRETRGTTKADALAAFRWIDELSPFRRDTAQRGGLLKLQAPAEMVVLDDARHWVAESADGAVVWTSKRKNAPQGSSDFWAAAIAERMQGDFAETSRVKIGGFDFVTFVDGGTTHYRYMIGVRAAGDDLEVIEVYYPTPEHEARYAPGVKAVIPGGNS